MIKSKIEIKQTLKQDFDNFVNKLRSHYLNSTSTVTGTTDNNKQVLGEPPPKNVEKKSNFRVKTASSHNLEVFIEKIEHIIFQPLNHNKNVFHNITKNERTALKEIKTWNDCCVRIQDKGSIFVILSNEDYCLKVMTQIERSSFITLSSGITKFFQKKVEGFIKKWEDLKVLDKKWASYIKPSNSKPGTIYGLIKTHNQIIQLE